MRRICIALHRILPIEYRAIIIHFLQPAGTITTAIHRSRLSNLGKADGLSPWVMLVYSTLAEFVADPVSPQISHFASPSLNRFFPSPGEAFSDGERNLSLWLLLHVCRQYRKLAVC